jgi:RNA polymerase sigma factor (TIGR02999 family)
LYNTFIYPGISSESNRRGQKITMASSKESEITDILLTIQSENVDTLEYFDRAFEIVYAELHQIASYLMQSERPGHTLQPTALVHEAYLRLVDQSRVEWKDRAHFLALSARAMRHILVDHARGHARIKRGGGWQRVTLSDQIGLGKTPIFDILELDDIMKKYADMDERMARVVEYRVFAGMTAKEAAHVIGVSRQTVQEDWRMAKVMLPRELRSGDMS